MTGDRVMTDAELREQRALIDAELEAREAERKRAEREAAEDERARARAARARERQALPSVGEWVEYEYTCCREPSCKVCRGTEYAHGPYWFRYIRSEGGRQTSRYVGLVLNERAAEVLAAHEERQRAKELRTREAAALRRGEDVAEIDEPLGDRSVGALVGLTPQEAYPEAFDAEELADAARRKEKKLERDRRKAERERADAGQAESTLA